MMRISLKSLYWKFILAFALVAFVTAALVGLFIRLTSADRLSQLIVDQQRVYLEKALADFYVTNGSWQGVAQSWRRIQIQTLPTPEAGATVRSFEVVRPADGDRRENFLGLADSQGLVIVSVDPAYPPGARLPQNVLQSGTSVMADGSQVGTILVASRPPGFNPQESLYLRRVTQALAFAIVASLIAALVIGALLARTLTHPIQALTLAARNITQGQLQQQVPVRSNDEIGQLAIAFNTMSQEVARVNQVRKQMTADIAHDLRTPLTVISGYIESMRDGVLKPTPQRLDLIYTEIERLQNLVGDLRMLSLADAGELSLNPQAVSVPEVLERAASVFRFQAEQGQVSLIVEPVDEPLEIQADESRLMQVLENLLSNALRYTPPGGQITLSAQRNGDAVTLIVRDTGEGIAAEELPYIFNRFHRADKSRHAEGGESGLGLAIVRALVELHGGTVTARSATGQGSEFRLSFPAPQPAP